MTFEPTAKHTRFCIHNEMQIIAEAQQTSAVWQSVENSSSQTEEEEEEETIERAAEKSRGIMRVKVSKFRRREPRERNE